jgi:ribokinase
MSLLVVGSLHLDVIVSAPRLPRPDETLTGEAVDYAFGGKGGNQAVAAARMGARVAFAGAVGSDAFAERLRAGLAEAGVDAAQVARREGPSGMSVAILQADGSYGAVIVSGANRAIDPEAIVVPAGTTWVLLQNEVPEAVNLAAAGRARAAGARVMLNAAPARPLAPALRALTDVLIVNRVEAAALATGGPDLPDPAAAARALVAGGVGTVIVTLGEGGLILADPVPRHLPARKVRALSSHGAGDAFAGALAARLDAGDPIDRAAAFARDAAALHVATPPAGRAALTPAAVAALASG